MRVMVEATVIEASNGSTTVKVLESVSQKDGRVFNEYVDVTGNGYNPGDKVLLFGDYTKIDNQRKWWRNAILAPSPTNGLTEIVSTLQRQAKQ